MDRGWIVWGIGLVVVVVATWFVLSDRTKRSEPQNLPVGDVVSRDDSLTMRGPWDVVRSDPANAEAMASEEVRAPDRPAVGHGAEAEGAAARTADAAAGAGERVSGLRAPVGTQAPADGGDGPAYVPSNGLEAQVTAFREARRLEQIDGTNRLKWRDALVEAAQSSPDSEWAVEALLEAGFLSADEPDLQEHLLRAAIEHPLVESTNKIMALKTVSGLAWYVRQDLVQAFADLNSIAETIEQLEPLDLRENWQPEADRIPLEKALRLEACRGRGQPVPALPAPDSGKQASDYYRECLELLPDVRARAGIGSEPGLLQAYGRTLAREGKREEAARAFRRLREHPESPHPPLFVCYLEAEALYPGGGPAFREALERAEREHPPDDFSLTLSMHIAFLYHQQGFGRECIERVEPLLTSDDPDERALAAKPNRRQDVLSMLGDCYARPDVRDYGKAIAYYEQLLTEFPDYHNRAGVYGNLARLYEYQLGNLQRAIEYYERLLVEFPGNRNAGSAAEHLERLYEKAAAEAADGVGMKNEGE